MKREEYTKRECKNSCNPAKKDIYIINKLKTSYLLQLNKKLCIKICTFKG